MAETKYGKQFTKDCYSIIKPDMAQIYSTRQLPDFGAGNFSIDCALRTKPHVMIKVPHKHTFDQYLCFFGTNSENIKDFDAEIEVHLGPEHEKHVITSPTVIHITPGLLHGPIVWMKVNKPVLFVDVAATNKYIRTDVPDDNLKFNKP